MLKTPKDFGWREDERFPYVRPEEQDRYDEVYNYNEAVLSSGTDQAVRAIEYMRKDVEYSWKLEDWLISEGNEIKPDDDDICNMIVAWCRYFGFPVDVAKGREVAEKFRLEMVE